MTAGHRAHRKVARHCEGYRVLSAQLGPTPRQRAFEERRGVLVPPGGVAGHRLGVLLGELVEVDPACTRLFSGPRLIHRSTIARAYSAEQEPGRPNTLRRQEGG